jgi:hypothetical protein
MPCVQIEVDQHLGILPLSPLLPSAANMEAATFLVSCAAYYSTLKIWGSIVLPNVCKLLSEYMMSLGSYLLKVCVMTLSVFQTTQQWMPEWCLNGQLETIIFQEGRSKTTECLNRDTDCSGCGLNQMLPNTVQKHYHFSQLAWYTISLPGGQRSSYSLSREPHISRTPFCLQVQMPHHETLSSHIPETRFKCLTIGIICISLTVGLLIPNIELVLGLVGSTIGVLICVMFPAVTFICISTKSTQERLLAQVSKAVLSSPRYAKSCLSLQHKYS